ncbi:MAG: SDR family oxidoreductase [Lentisphaerae bacterium]|nr:SDR family oxidoreductase [Lentisphaerota bacterium]
MNVLDLFCLKGRVAVVTGGARGLGRQHALALAEAGADVAICDLLEAEGEQTRRELEALGVKALFGKVNVTAGNEIDGFIKDVEANLGPVRILVNNAARPSEGCALADLDDRLWREILETNLAGVFYVGKRAASRMAAAGRGGSIINVASINAHVISNIAPRYNAAYCAAKAAVENLSKSMAAQWAPQNIRVNTLAPGYIHTQQTAATAVIPEALKRNIENTPMKRYGRIDELKGAIVFLASDASSYMTGGTLVMDGGYTVW